MLRTGSVSERADPEPCREQDLGLFEVIVRDGAARIGRLHTAHGHLNTPALLPVVNPNLRTIEPREMWERYGVDALITNSYVIWKHDDLRETALADGIHSMLDFPGVVVTDSGTFQSYVYGDVEVGVSEIVEFQRDIGVDIGTMLDVFGRPDMSREELEECVDETARRAEQSLESAGPGMLLNGPVQGGLHEDLRASAGNLMGSASSEFRGFAVHPVGGIVPLMEKQRYRELFEILLAVRSTTPSDRPVHLFGCGHPMLFPMAIALGADLFDSAAYAIFARDDRILSPHGTFKLEGLNEWPIHSATLFGHTPEQVREMGTEERSTLLAHHNLEITQAELARCREAIRDSSIWQLAERRSHASPHLRNAFEWVLEQFEEIPDGPVGDSALELLASTDPLRKGGERISEDIGARPYILHLHALLSLRWRPPGSWWDGSGSGPERVVLIEGTSPPWRHSAMGAAVTELLEAPRSVVMLSPPLGPIPFSLEDVSPWCHLDCPEEVWSEAYEDEEVNEALFEMGLADIPLVRTGPREIPDSEDVGVVRAWLDRCAVVDKLSVLCGVSPADGCSLTEGMVSRRSRTDRVVNVLLGDEHILSPRLSDGGISLALAGARRLNTLNPSPPARFGEQVDEVSDHPGVPRVWLLDDAIPFVGRGRNVMHGYVLGADPHLTPGQPCLVVDGNGALVAHGTALSTAREMAHLKKGVAVRVRDGALRED